METGDIVQVTNRNHRWFPSLVIVTEVHSWGIQGYSTVPTFEGQAFIRLEAGSYEKVGRAVVVMT